MFVIKVGTFLLKVVMGNKLDTIIFSEILDLSSPNTRKKIFVKDKMLELIFSPSYGCRLGLL